MTPALPAGWEVRRLDEVADVRLGRQRSPKNHQGLQMRPYLRAANVSWSGLLLDDVKQMNFTDDEMSIYRLARSDIILSEASGSPDEVGKPAIWSGEITDCAFQNTLLRVRSLGPEPKYLLHYFRHLALSRAFGRSSRGVGIHHIGRAALASWPVPIPPLDEQRRLVEILEDHLSRIDAAEAALGASRRRLAAFRASCVAQILRCELSDASTTLSFGDRELSLPGTWRASTVGEEADVVEYGSGSKASAMQASTAVPVLRMGNIKDGQVVWESLKFFPGDHPDVERLRLQPGDLLFNRTNSAEHVGKCAVFDGKREATFASYLIRVRFRESVNPRWASLVLNSVFGRAYIKSVVSQQVGQANVNGTKLRAFPLPVPPRSVQDVLLESVSANDQVARRLSRQIDRGQARVDVLRRALLAAAFSGALVGEQLVAS